MSDVILTKEALLKSGLPEETVTINDLGAVRVRSLSRAEFLQLRQADADGWEIGIVVAGLVEPALTEDEVRDWHRSIPPKVFDDLAGEILRVSGLRKVAEQAVQAAVGAAKRNFQDEARAGDGVLPGGTPAHDGDQDAGGDGGVGVHPLAGPERDEEGAG